MGRRVVSKRIVKGASLKSRKSVGKTSAGFDHNKTALYAIIAIVAIVVIIILMKSRVQSNVAGQATTPAGYQGCYQYWNNYCLKYECTKLSEGCRSYCEQRTTTRCQTSSI